MDCRVKPGNDGGVLHRLEVDRPRAQARNGTTARRARGRKIRGSAMHSAVVGILGLFLFASSLAEAATITGTVSGPDGAPFRAAFVQARHAKLKMTVSVLSDKA